MDRRYIFLIGQPSEASEDGPAVDQIVNLPHPVTGENAKYMLTVRDVYEIQLLKASKYSSFFVGQAVQSDGNFYVASRIDPLFIVLPVFSKHGTRYSPLDQILSAGSVAGEHNFLQIASCNHLKLSNICDVNDRLGPDSIFYRINEAKVVAWLKMKIKQVYCHLKSEKGKSHMQVGGSFVRGFEATSKSTGSSSGSDTKDSVITTDPEFKLAAKLIFEYICEEWQEKVLQSYSGLGAKDLEEASGAAPAKRKAWEAPDAERDRLLALTGGGAAGGGGGGGGGGSGGDKKLKAAPVVKKTAAQNKLSKGSTKGMKSIASFFGKKK